MRTRTGRVEARPERERERERNKKKRMACVVSFFERYTRSLSTFGRCLAPCSTRASHRKEKRNRELPRFGGRKVVYCRCLCGYRIREKSHSFPITAPSFIWGARCFASIKPGATRSSGESEVIAAACSKCQIRLEFHSHMYVHVFFFSLRSSQPWACYTYIPAALRS